MQHPMSPRHPVTPSPRLRLYVAETDEPPQIAGPTAPPAAIEPEHPQGASPEWTLSEFYYRLAEQRGIIERNWQPGNVVQYRESIGFWVSFTGDPPLRSVDQQSCLEFQERLKERTWRGRPIASNTRLKHVTTIQSVLDMAGPRSRINGRKHGLDKYGIFGFDADGDRREPPILSKPRLVLPTPKPFSLREIGLWMAACDRVEVPKVAGIAPSAWWRALILWSYNVGTRIESTLTLRWDWLEDHVDAEGEEHHWIVIPAEHVKGQAQETKVWVNQFAREAIDQIRTSDGRIFPWPFAQNYYQANAKKLLVRSGIPAKRHHRGGTHRLRGALLSWLTARNPGIAKLQSGHRGSRDIILQHYADPGIVAKLMGEVPQPRPSRAGAPRPTPSDARQMTLF